MKTRFQSLLFQIQLVPLHLGGLEGEIESLQAQIAMERQVHSSTADFLRKRNGELTKKVVAWVDKHDIDKENKVGLDKCEFMSAQV